nr:N-acetyltransferase [Vibrio pectenicida]
MEKFLFSSRCPESKKNSRANKRKIYPRVCSSVRRKLWVVKNKFGNIKGHIDLRHHNVESRSHRVLLGMGVDASCRKQGLGQRLIDVVIDFCQEKVEIDWLDLCVLSGNIPAKNLYLKTGFSFVGEFKDQYRIDGLSVSEIAMTKYVKKHS